MNISLRTKSIIGVLCLVVTMASLNTFTFWFLRGSMQDMAGMIDTSSVMNELLTLAGKKTEGLPLYIEEYSTRPYEENRVKIEATFRKINRLLQVLEAAPQNPDVELQLGLVGNMFRSVEEKYREMLTKIEAGAPASEINQLVSDFQDSSPLIAEAIEWLISIKLSHDKIIKESLSETADRNGVIMFLAILFTSAIGFVLGYKYLMVYGILAPLRRLQKTIESIAVNKEKDFHVHLEYTREDEIGKLFQYFNEMAERIQIYKKSLEELVDDRTEALALAEKANQAKSLFLANMSHELRTPMHGILSFARFGQQKIDTASKDKIKSYFDEIYQSGARLMTLLNDVLDLSKLEAGKVDYSMKEHNITELVQSVATQLTAFAEENNRTIEVKSDDPQISGIFDDEKIAQVLRNLLTNAIKFSDKGSIIRIVAAEKDGLICCSVINYGPGIPNSELVTIFDKFVQSSKTRNGAGGTGLGLAICSEIVAQHGGKLWAESTLGEQTKFIMQLPKHASQSEAA